GTRTTQRLMKTLGRLQPRALLAVGEPRRQDPDRNVEPLRRPPQQIESLIGPTTVLGHQHALGLLDHRHSVQPGRPERRGPSLYGSSLHGVHYGTPAVTRPHLARLPGHYRGQHPEG